MSERRSQVAAREFAQVAVRECPADQVFPCDWMEAAMKACRILAAQPAAPADPSFAEAADWLERESKSVYGACRSDHAEAASWLRNAAPAVLAEPVAWIVYLPSMQTQEIFDSQEDSGYVDWLTNYPDAEVTPLYTHPASQARSPLTREQIDHIHGEWRGPVENLVRAIERAHGIGSATTEAKSHE